VTGARPTKVRVHVGSRTVVADVDLDGTVRFPRTLAQSMSVTVLASTPVRSLNGGSSVPMPVVVGEITVEGLENLARSLPPDQATGMPCGFGPRLTVDGRSLPTEVTGTVGDLLAGHALHWQACQPVVLAAGTHRLRAESTVQFVVRDLRFGDGGTSAGAETAQVPKVHVWGRTARTLTVAPSATPRVLTVQENANPGWNAALDGHELQPVTVDGWAQGWAVPAGSGGTVRLTFAPQRTFIGGLLGGAALALAVVVMAVVRPRRQVASAVVPVGWAAPATAAALGTAALLLAVCGPLGLLALPLAGLAAVPRTRSVLLVATALAATAWTLTAAVAPWPTPAATNRQGAAEVLAAVVLASVVALVVVSPRRSRGR
jgi:arabinofuranan 3-O-arabinosyltransferase